MATKRWTDLTSGATGLIRRARRDRRACFQTARSINELIETVNQTPVRKILVGKCLSAYLRQTCFRCRASASEKTAFSLQKRLKTHLRNTPRFFEKKKYISTSRTENIYIMPGILPIISGGSLVSLVVELKIRLKS